MNKELPLTAIKGITQLKQFDPFWDRKTSTEEALEVKLGCKTIEGYNKVRKESKDKSSEFINSNEKGNFLLHLKSQIGEEEFAKTI